MFQPFAIACGGFDLGLRRGELCLRLSQACPGARGIAGIDAAGFGIAYTKGEREFEFCLSFRSDTAQDPDGFAEADAAKLEIQSIVNPLIDNWIENPDDSAISHWLHDGMPDGETRSLAELTLAEKRAISHRGRALEALKAAHAGGIPSAPLPPMR